MEKIELKEKLSAEELEKISAGSVYNARGYLVTTINNSCNGFIAENTGDSKKCKNCSRFQGVVFGFGICVVRRKNDDPYK